MAINRLVHLHYIRHLVFRIVPEQPSCRIIDWGEERLKATLYRSYDTPVEEVSVIVAYQCIEDNQSYQFMKNLILLVEKQAGNGILNHLQCEQVFRLITGTLRTSNRCASV